MTLKDPNYIDEKGRVVRETWTDGKLVSKEISDTGDRPGYHEVIKYDESGNTEFRQVKEPTPHGFHKLEEHYEQGFMTSQTEEIDENPVVITSRQFYPQTLADGTKLDKPVLHRETIRNCTTGQTQVKEFSITGEEILPTEKKIPLSFAWKHKGR